MKNILTGKTQEHLILDNTSQLLVHQKMQAALNLMRQEAASAGFNLSMTSAFRGFDQQLAIWNAKARGLKPLYNDQGVALDYNQLSSSEIVYAILRWSALPGASRHHWGTDIDVYDQSRMPKDYKVQLLPSETEPEGIFGEFHQWLDQNLERFDFYRPYAQDTGGIAPERWHLSYAPIAHGYQQALTYELIEETILNAQIDLKPIVLKNLPEIYQRFINI